MKIILASTSVYRRELLGRLGLEFECLAPEVDESMFSELPLAPADLASRLAQEKARAVAANRPEAIVIGADQVVDLAGKTLGKPGDQEKARQQLRMLAGKTHCLHTAVTVWMAGAEYSLINETRLRMRPLDDGEIYRYVTLDDPIHCAGSYMVERAGISLFDEVETSDFTAITGLPLLGLSGVLRSLGVAIP
ncbi:MAG: Maf family protein [Planctomycetaceae bacterium]